MEFIYLGAEVGSNRVILEEAGATYMGISFHRLKKRGLPLTKKYLISNYFQPNAKIFVHAGVPREAKLNGTELEEFAAEYEEFILDNIDRIAMFTEFDHPALTSDFIAQQRKTVWASVAPGKFLPVWQSSTGVTGLKQLVENYLDIGLRGEDIEGELSLAHLTRTHSLQNATRFHAVSCAKPDNLRQVAVETASSMAWLSPMMRGETIVWNGSRLVRYPARMKDQARPRYKAAYEKAGLDMDLILEDDPKEVSKLAVWSYNQLELRLSMGGNISDMSSENDSDDFAETTPAVHDKMGVETRKVEQRKPEEMGVLPVFGFKSKQVQETMDDGTVVFKEIPLVETTGATLRQCNTCYIAANCPAFKVDTACAFKMPLEVKSKEQLKALINALIEMQGNRIAFAHFVEELNGGYPDPNVSQEMDRLFKMLKTTKELDDSKEFVRMTVERQGSAGLMSAIFGDQNQAMKELPPQGLNEVQTTKIIKDITEG